MRLPSDNLRKKHAAAATGPSVKLWRTTNKPTRAGKRSGVLCDGRGVVWTRNDTHRWAEIVPRDAKDIGPDATMKLPTLD